MQGTAIQPQENPTIEEKWAGMEKLLGTGKVKSIGVADFRIPLLERLLKSAKVVPAVNQVEVHPCLPREDLRVFCATRDIRVVAYAPFGKRLIYIWLIAKHKLEQGLALMIYFGIPQLI